MGPTNSGARTKNGTNKFGRPDQKWDQKFWVPGPKIGPKPGPKNGSKTKPSICEDEHHTGMMPMMPPDLPMRMKSVMMIC